MSKLKTTLLIVVVVLLGLFISSQTMAAVCTVPGTHLTIQAAVSDGSCEPIIIAARTFTETGQIVINRNLTIAGAGAGKTVIKPANNTTCCTNGQSDAWIYVNTGVTFSLNNVTLDGSGRKIHHAIQSHGSVTAQDCDIRNIRYDLYYGIAIRLLTGSNVVRRCTFSGIERIGVHIRGSVEPINPVATIESCTYLGKGASTSLDYAFEAGAGGKAQIKNNHISNCGTSSSGWGSSGILATTYYGPGTQVEITGNTITNNEYGIAIGYDSNDTTLAVANNNNIYGNQYGMDDTSALGSTDAENNWWGSSTGPTHSGNPGGTGDPVSDNIGYTPWLTQPVELVPLTVFWKDYNGQTAGGYMPDIDQNQDFDKVEVRTEETDPTVILNGTWGTTTDSRASGGSLKYTMDPNATCTFSFNGSSIKWIGAKAYNRGQADVYIDGQLDATVNQYDPIILWQQVIYSNTNLISGPHTIMIKPIDAPGKYIDIDAFDVDDIEKEYCAPVAEANSLWWLDKKYANIEIFSTPLEGTGYIGGDINGDGIADVLDLVQELATMMNTNGGGHTGTTIEGEQAGIEAFLAKYQLGGKLYKHTADPDQYPDWLSYFSYIEEEVERSQDVKLDLGFWHVDNAIPAGPGLWQVWWSRRGGHAVTVAGVDSQNFLLAISDPDNNAAESGGLGVIRPVPDGHLLHPNDPTAHNNEINASHDIYTVGPSPSPGGKMGLLNFPWKWNLPPGEWETLPPMIVEWPEPLEYCQTFTEIEAAVIVSPIICGNNVIDPGETCDPPGSVPLFPQGNQNLCRQTCTYCGDNNVDPGEQCDDGNLVSGDGCTPTCQSEPDISVSPASLSFGKVVTGSSSAPKTVTVSNAGVGNLNIGTITISGANPSQFSKLNDNCSGQSVAPSSSCTVQVKFSPTSAGAKSATLSIPSDDPDSAENPASISLSGNGVKVMVTSPNGGETLRSRDTHTITWQTGTTANPVAKVVIKYTLNGTTWNTATITPHNTGSYYWSVPYVGSIKTKCKVKVILKDASGNILGSDMSDSKFTIEPRL